MENVKTDFSFKARQTNNFFLFLIFAACLYVAQDSYLVFDILTLIGFVFFVKEAILILKHPQNARFSSILIIAILSTASLGTIVFMLAQGTLHVEKYQYFIRFGLYYTQPGLSRALAANYLAIALLYFFSVYDKPLQLEEIKNLRDNPRAELILLLGSGLIFLALLTGKLGFAGASVTEGQKGVSPIGSIAALMLPALVTLSFMIVFTTKSNIKKIVFGCILFILMLVLMMYHRRSLVYTIFICGMIWSIFNVRRKNYPYFKIISLSLLSIIIIYIGFMSFYAMRFTKNYFGKAIGITTQIDLATSIIKNGGFSLISAGLQKNVSGRTMYIGYLGGIMSQPRNHLPMYGKELALSVNLSIPSAFLPGKENIIQSPEEIAHPRAGIAVFDGPNSILTSGYDDFGIVGMAFYPTLAVIIVNFLLSFFYRHLFRSRYVYLFFTICMIYAFLCVGVEDALNSFIVEIRNLVIVGIIMTLIIKSTYFFNLKDKKEIQ